MLVLNPNFLRFLFLVTISSGVLSFSKKDCKCQLQPIPNDKNLFIIGGNNAKHNSYPWMASIAGDGIDRTSPFRFFETTEYKMQNTICGGTILNNNWILTAAHCVSNPNSMYTVGFGNSNDKLKLFENRIGVQKVIIHPNYNGTGLVINDIALLELKEPIEFGADYDVAPGCLSIHHYEEQKIKNPVLLAAGFGQTSYFKENKETKERVFFPDRNTRYLKEVLLRYHSEEPIRDECLNDKNKLCVINLMGEDSVCLGDSGGPIHQIRTNGRTFVAGSLSSVAQYSVSNDPDFWYYCKGQATYQLVKPYINWIRSYINDDYCDDRFDQIF